MAEYLFCTEHAQFFSNMIAYNNNNNNKIPTTHLPLRTDSLTAVHC